MLELAPRLSVDVFYATLTIANVEEKLGHQTAALKYFDEAIAIGTEVYAPEHLSVLQARVGRAGVLPKSRDAEAKIELEAALARPEITEELATTARQYLKQRALPR